MVEYLEKKSKEEEEKEKENKKKREKLIKKGNIRFQNCAILKLCIRSSEESATLDLVYAGSLSKQDDKKVYYKLKEDTRIDTPIGNTYVLCSHNTRIRCFINEYFSSFESESDTEKKDGYDLQIEFKKRKCDIIKLLENNSNIEDTDIYIIRHGEAMHNPLKGAKKFYGQTFGEYDTELTQEGNTQAKLANKFLKDLLKDITVKKVFASKLKRTRDTVSLILNGINCEDKQDNKIKITVLPCVHELGTYKDKKCDEKNLITANENKTKCEKIINQKNNNKCKGNDNYTVDWSYFNEFFKHKNKCKNTNIVKVIFDYIKVNQSNST